jgi:hypothetical protein
VGVGMKCRQDLSEEGNEKDGGAVGFLLSCACILNGHVQNREKEHSSETNDTIRSVSMHSDGMIDLGETR